MTNDPHRIIPRGAMAAIVRPMDLQIRYMVDYDTRYMQDRVRADIFVNGQPLGPYAVAVVDDRGTYPVHPQDAILRYAPDLERVVLNEFSTALSHGRRVDDLEAVVDHLRNEIASLTSRRWWHPTRDAVRDLWWRCRAVF